ncbi:MAG: hypothetical protein ACK5UX_06015 [Burkholderiales bacterium]|jgi:hypothetical protein|nr:hypothetical protein [Nitrosomonadaceae bacterium]
MNKRLLARALAVWLLIILAESIHGTLRTLLLVPLMGDFPARQVSVFTGAVIIFAVAWFTHRWMWRERVSPSVVIPSERSDEESAFPPNPTYAIGTLWVALTITFEITLGRALGMPWSRILEDYNLLQGGLMPLGLVALWATPWLVARLRR